VPTLTWGLVRSNFSLDMDFYLNLKIYLLRLILYKKSNKLITTAS
jgi:hypothetical protein